MNIALLQFYNHTDYAQVFKEQVDDGTDITTTTYVIGDDVLAQATNYAAPADVEYLLYDGHGSTRQLAEYNSVNDTVSIAETYSYDAYGVMLGGNPTSAPATSLLYAGEQFDVDAQMYYNRARYYDQNTGRFNRMDPFAGSPQDPQSLHKYLYCHNNPVNGIDPSGREFSLIGMLKFATIVGCISSIITTVYGYAKGWSEEQIVRAQLWSFGIGFGAGILVYGTAWSISALWVWITGGGIVTAEQAAQEGFNSHRELVNYWRGQGATDPIHHFVQQTVQNINTFGHNAIYSLRNTVPLARNLHIELHRFTQSSTTNLGLSNDIGHYSNLWRYIQTLPWEAQYRWGVAMVNYLMTTRTMQGFDPISHGLI